MIGRGRRYGRGFGRRVYYRPFPVLGLVVRVVAWLVAAVVAAALVAAAWPLVVAGLWAYVAAWAAGWPPRRLVVAAGWCVPMVAAFEVAYLVAGDGAWQVAAWSPAESWVRAWHALAAGSWLRAMVIIAPTAIPLGLVAGAVGWRLRIGLIESGAAGWSPGAAVAFDERQWKRAVRSASWRVHAPGGPPLDSADFLARLDAGWLAGAWAGVAERSGEVRAAGPLVGEVRLRFRTMFARLGPGFDGAAAVTDFDALYCVVEGTASTAVREAQARALTELVADAAASWSGDGRRAGLLVLDEFSAVSGRVPVHELAERCRSLGLAVVVAAQSWEGLAPDESSRARLAWAAAGGVVVMRCADPDSLCSLAGTRRVTEVGRKIVRPGRYGDEGSGRVQNAWVADPDRVRNFRAGQAAWIHGNSCVYVQVAPWRRAPLALSAGPVPAEWPTAAGGAPAPAGEPAGWPAGPEVPLPGGTR